MTPSCLLDHALAFRLGNALQNQRQPCTDELRNPTRYARRMVVMKVTAQVTGIIHGTFGARRDCE